MSMLAEPRRKQKWSVDPRNSAWSNDDSKFGQKMLERMGWTKGKGLGRSEQGSTDHIKVKVKNNSYGLGVTTSHEDNWIAHQDEFNELLAQLNNHHGQNIDNCSDNPPDESKGFSLEEKSKTSRKRVHYMKFTKGKDLSSRSETDLNCIFGKRARSAKDQEQESNSSDSQDETEESGTLATSELDTESITKTVKSTLTMQEYFAQRMAQLKKARGASSTSFSVGAESTETSRPTEELNIVHNSSDESEETKRKKKKKKKNRKPAEDVEMTEEKCSTPTVVEDQENQEQECLRKKKKKRKMTKNDNDGNEECSSTQCLELDCEKLPPSKKKNLKKHKKSELLNGHHPAENETEESEVTQKEGHREEDSVVKDEREVVKKKSKKKKRKTENQE